ncbi:transmembrane and ubiquitin-like domain-containing protein 1 isoform X6 [Manduca sexta]|uniref:transmembrane and ubiquitin-like domain-containing protein 1 isoform X6 n=1 Tax=Manduca sexta TaxID=7130 RepID=UPI001184611E|nr:transmembrane and ubiquitin-like domain-containing protein 1 isoform X6 [Manduca sexta]
MPLLLRMMPLIEGVGDEVVQFAAAVLVVVVAVLAWWSTNARPDRYRTVLVMRSRSHPITVSILTRSNRISHLTLSNAQANSPGQPIVPEGPTPTSSQSASDSASESEAPEDAEPASNAQIREMDSIVNAMEADVTAGCDFFTRANASDATASSETASVNRPEKKDDLSTNPKDNAGTPNENPSEDSATTSQEGNRRKILIKLKYLNDTLKEVEGSLDELLKDFKLRHFSSELSSECRVRLIFNGRVLCDEGATLRACGLHHRAVVHCLVHPKRTAAGAGAQQPGMPDEPSGAPTHELITERQQPERAWDLENILMTLVSVALTIVWFFSILLQVRVLEHVHGERERGAVRADRVLQRRDIRALPVRHIPDRPPAAATATATGDQQLDG